MEGAIAFVLVGISIQITLIICLLEKIYKKL